MEATTPILVFWRECQGDECDYTTVAHGRVVCPDCGEAMMPTEVAGAVLNDYLNNHTSGNDAAVANRQVEEGFYEEV